MSHRNFTKRKDKSDDTKAHRRDIKIFRNGNLYQHGSVRTQAIVDSWASRSN